MAADSICWYCAKAGRCKKPVAGWDADYRPVLGSGRDGRGLIPSWFVRSCPNFIRDRIHEPEIGKRRIRLLNTLTREVREFGSVRECAKFLGGKESSVAASVNKALRMRNGKYKHWIIQGV